MDQKTRRIVVGVDGSEPAERALEWAAGEARLRDADLEVVTAWEASRPLYGAGAADVAAVARVEPGVRDAVAQHAQTVADHAARRAAARGARAVPHAVEGHVANTLVELSGGADLLVVGNRGHGGFGSLLLGSVSAQCAHHASCPVVIVR